MLIIVHRHPRPVDPRVPDRRLGGSYFIDKTHLVAVAVLARYNGRALDVYRFDLRTFFQWAFR
jgi:hypothetical protein